MLQLNTIVAYHKALADPTRIRILILLADGPMHGQALAEKLAVTPPTISHHIAKLREAALIHETRDKNTIYLSLNEYFLRENANALNRIILKDNRKQEEETMQTPEALKLAEKNEKLKKSVLSNFFSEDGRLKLIPAQHKKKLIVMERLLEGLEQGKVYQEKEINEHIRRFHEDFATIRREFIINQYMYREKEQYELNPQELWVKWREL